IGFAKTTGFSGTYLSSVTDTVLWYGKDSSRTKYRQPLRQKELGEAGATQYRPISRYPQLLREGYDGSRLVTSADLTSQGASPNSEQRFSFKGKHYSPPSGLHWK